MSTQTFTLPDVGEGLTEAEIVTWRVAPGDAVRLRLDGGQAHLFDTQGRGYRAAEEART